jgi:hypothetical protein
MEQNALKSQRHAHRHLRGDWMGTSTFNYLQKKHRNNDVRHLAQLIETDMCAIPGFEPHADEPVATHKRPELDGSTFK